jgi:hypothetical protein
MTFIQMDWKKGTLSFLEVSAKECAHYERLVGLMYLRGSLSKQVHDHISSFFESLRGDLKITRHWGNDDLNHLCQSHSI